MVIMTGGSSYNLNRTLTKLISIPNVTVVGVKAKAKTITQCMCKKQKAGAWRGNGKIICTRMSRMHALKGCVHACRPICRLASSRLTAVGPHRQWTIAKPFASDIPGVQWPTVFPPSVGMWLLQFVYFATLQKVPHSVVSTHLHLRSTRRDALPRF